MKNTNSFLRFWPCSFLVVVACTLLMMGIVGCSPSSSLSGLVACKGKVTLDGSSVGEGAILSFSPTGGGTARAATGKTNAQGEFVMSTLQPEDGVAPGEYNVTVIKYEVSGPAPKPYTTPEGDEITPAAPTKNVLPAKYATADKTECKVTIPAGGNKSLVIELTK